MTRFVDVNALAQLVQRVGVAPLLATLEATLREDFLRWDDFDKCARVASHSALGVELVALVDSRDSRNRASLVVENLVGHMRRDA